MDNEENLDDFNSSYDLSYDTNHNLDDTNHNLDDIETEIINNMISSFVGLSKQEIKNILIKSNDGNSDNNQNNDNDLNYDLCCELGNDYIDHINDQVHRITLNNINKICIEFKNKLIIDYINKKSYKMDQKSKEWLDHRGNLIGGSEIKDIIGGYYRNAVKNKLAPKGSLDHIIAIIWGNLFEPVIDLYTELKFNTKLYHTGSFIKKGTKCSCSVDGLAVINNQIAMCEWKCPYSRKPNGSIPPSYIHQVKHNTDIVEIAEVGFYGEAVFRCCKLNDIGYNDKYNTEYPNKDFKENKKTESIKKFYNMPVACGVICFSYEPNIVTIPIDDYDDQIVNQNNNQNNDLGDDDQIVNQNNNLNNDLGNDDQIVIQNSNIDQNNDNNPNHDNNLNHYIDNDLGGDDDNFNFISVVDIPDYIKEIYKLYHSMKVRHENNETFDETNYGKYELHQIEQIDEFELDDIMNSDNLNCDIDGDLNHDINHDLGDDNDLNHDADHDLGDDLDNDKTETNNSNTFGSIYDTSDIIDFGHIMTDVALRNMKNFKIHYSDIYTYPKNDNLNYGNNLDDNNLDGNNLECDNSVNFIDEEINKVKNETEYLVGYLPWKLMQIDYHYSKKIEGYTKSYENKVNKILDIVKYIKELRKKFIDNKPKYGKNDDDDSDLFNKNCNDPNYDFSHNLGYDLNHDIDHDLGYDLGDESNMPELDYENAINNAIDILSNKKYVDDDNITIAEIIKKIDYFTIFD